MSRDLVYLCAICHEDSKHSLHNLNQMAKVNHCADPPANMATECSSATITTTQPMPSAQVRRTRSLISMYSTGVVFPQNRMRHLKTLQTQMPIPLAMSHGVSTAMNPLSAEDKLQLMTRLALVGTGAKMTSAGEHMKKLVEADPERAASMFALVV